MSVTVEGLPQLRASLRALTAQNIGGVKREVMRAALEIQAGAKRRCPVDLSRLRNSIAIKLDADGLGATVGTNVGSAASVEFGSRPHWAPIGPLKGWAKRHGMDEGAAYAIQKTIAKRGTRAQPFMFPAFEEVRPQFYARLRAVLATGAK
jgi:hypothetical protein